MLKTQRQPTHPPSLDTYASSFACASARVLKKEVYKVL